MGPPVDELKSIGSLIRSCVLGQEPRGEATLQACPTNAIVLSRTDREWKDGTWPTGNVSGRRPIFVQDAEAFSRNAAFQRLITLHLVPRRPARDGEPTVR
jgi:hypothetical protein